MNDNKLLTAMRSSLTGVKDSLTDVHMDCPVSATTGRARAAVALGAGLSFTLTAGPAASRSVHVNLDAWSVNTTSTGQVELTVRELQDQALLEQTLANAGVPAIVKLRRVLRGGRPGG
jgi:hypothetical protein